MISELWMICQGFVFLFIYVIIGTVTHDQTLKCKIDIFPRLENFLEQSCYVVSSCSFFFTEHLNFNVGCTYLCIPVRVTLSYGAVDVVHSQR